MLGGYLMAAFFLVGAPAALVVSGGTGPGRCACAAQVCMCCAAVHVLRRCACAAQLCMCCAAVHVLRRQNCWQTCMLLLWLGGLRPGLHLPM
jgi:hypothetical protein